MKSSLQSKARALAGKLYKQVKADKSRVNAVDVLEVLEQTSKELEKQGKSALLPHVVTEFKHELQSDTASNTAVVSAPAELSNDQLKELKKKLDKKFDTDINIVTEIDSTILGGIVIRYKDQVIDLSVNARINSIRNKLKS